MGLVGREEELPTDQNKMRQLLEARAASERIAADRCKAVERLSAEAKHQESIAKSDARIMAKQEAQAKAQAEADRKRQEEAYAKFLATPLTSEEQKELEKLEVLASSFAPVTPMAMMRLRDLRIKDQVEEAENQPRRRGRPTKAANQ